MLFKLKQLSGIVLIGATLQAHATESIINQEKRAEDSTAPTVDPFSNNSSVQNLEKEISIDAADEIRDSKEAKLLKSSKAKSATLEEQKVKELEDSYISPYNYLQDPISLNMGLDPRAKASGTYHGGLSTIVGMSAPMSSLTNPTGGNNNTINTNIAQIWGQTGRLGGFALGGSATGVLNFTQNPNGSNNFNTTSYLAPSQWYLNYQYSNKFDISAGAILITTPWVNSITSAPGATYAMGNNTYQGAVFNVQALPSLLITGFAAWNYQQYSQNYSNYWFNQQNLYRGSLAGINGETTGSYVAGLGATWNPVENYSGQFWLYEFGNFARMAYVDNEYNLALSEKISMDFGLQGFMQGSSGANVTTTKTNTKGIVDSNGLGLKFALNLWNNTTSISYNTIFGPGSYGSTGSAGAMITPYTYGLETDPLYTTPALTSLAEQGAGNAYTIRNSTAFLNKTLRMNFSFSQFFINGAQPNGQITEYDAGLIYTIPKINMNIWSRLVYLQNPDLPSGNMLQPRLILNWTF